VRAREFIYEMAALAKASPASLPEYFKYINDVIRKGGPLQIGKLGNEGTLMTSKDQPEVKSINDVIKGEVNGEQVSVPVKNIFKSDEMKAASKGKEVKDVLGNKGEIAEGIFAVATLAKMTQGRNGSPITAQDVFNFITQLPDQGPANKAWSSGDLASDMTDTFALTVALKPTTYSDFKDTDKLKRLMGPEVNAIVAYVNSPMVQKYMKYFAYNKRPDTVHIIADGISDEKGSKVDVMMHYKTPQGEVVKKNFDLSVKTGGGTAQIGQVGGGRQTASLSERYNLLVDLFGRFGVDIEAGREEFSESKDIIEAYDKAYSFGARMLQTALSGSTYKEESEELQKLIDGVKYFGTLGDDRVKLVQFTKAGYYVLDFKHLKKLYNNDKIDLDARFVKTGKRPQVQIYDKESNKNLLTIRMNVSSSGRITNAIEKGELLKDLTIVRTNIEKYEK